ncbi:MAG: 4-fold beta flower protein [Porticoccaceae bacterium]
MIPKDRHWIFNNKDEAVAILDDDCIRDLSGYVIAWYEENWFEGRIFSLVGEHIGWINLFGRVLDIDNKILGFSQSSLHYECLKGWLKAPPEPVFAPKPVKARLRPHRGNSGEYGGKSHIPLQLYLI